MTVLGVIPARYGSTRLRAKPLVMIAGKSLVQRVWERAKKVRSLTKVVVATDDKRIVDTVDKFAGKAIITSKKCSSGSERCAEVARKISAEIIINIQGDEPLIEPQIIEKLVQTIKNDKSVMMATLATPLKSKTEFVNPNIVKVVVDKNFNALYFSRAMIPYPRNNPESVPKKVYKHLGLYAFRRSLLLNWNKMKKSVLEETECLEQLRVLENGYKIKVAIVNSDTCSVDTADDVKKVEKILSNMSSR